MVAENRPLFGHEDALEAVRRMHVWNRLPHALLVTGPDGVGKTTFALSLAADLACDNPAKEGAHCGVCHGCVLAFAGSHPDILRISPPKEETTIGQMRELRYTATLAPSLASRRVIIIEKAETLNEQAANAILKVLEDAPDHLLLLTLAPSSQSVLPTIESRSIEIPLKPVAQRLLAEYLQTRGVEPAQAIAVASYTGGAPGQAISLSDNPELMALLERIGAWIDRLNDEPVAAALVLAEELGNIADIAKKHIKTNVASDESVMVSDRQAIAWTLDALMASPQLSFNSSASKWDAGRAALMVDEINHTRGLIMSYAVADLHLEYLTMKLLQIR